MRHAAHFLLSIAILVGAIVAFVKQRSLVAQLVSGVFSLIGACGTLMSVVFYISCRKGQ